jgi:hypothetical protein
LRCERQTRSCPSRRWTSTWFRPFKGTKEAFDQPCSAQSCWPQTSLNAALRSCEYADAAWPGTAWKSPSSASGRSIPTWRPSSCHPAYSGFTPGQGDSTARAGHLPRPGGGGGGGGGGWGGGGGGGGGGGVGGGGGGGGGGGDPSSTKCPLTKRRSATAVRWPYILKMELAPPGAVMHTERDSGNWSARALRLIWCARRTRSKSEFA